MLRFTTNAYPKEQRWDSWRFALQRKSLKLEALSTDTAYGELSSYQSTQGVDFISVSSTAQIVKIDMQDQPDHIWLLQLLEGDLKVSHGAHNLSVREGDIVFGDGNIEAVLDFHRDHRFLLIKVPKPYLALRVRNPLPDGINLIASDTGAGRILSGMLRSVADTINDLNTDRVRPVELSLPEFLLTALMEGAPSKSLGGSAGARAMLLERMFQTIEMHLSDPNLNLQQVASEHGISMRYLQKLFETVDESFGHYVKLRRLERCRMDLLSPLHAQKSISDILFQWGFNDSASFSRAFREQYGVSPREYRKSPPLENEDAEAPRRGRPTARQEKPPVAEDEPLEIDEAVAAGADAEDAPLPVQSGVRHHYLPASPETVHWGYISRNLKPTLRVQSGDYVTIETLTHHAADDYERMIEGDAGAESVYAWTPEGKAIERRGAGPMDGSAVGRGAGEGFGVHICTGPIGVMGAKPGDVVEVRFLEIKTRPSANPKFAGRSFGSNVAAYWGFHYHDLLTEPKPREVVTIYEVETGHERCCAHAVYNFRYTPQIDPYGTKHDRYDYPGVPIDHTTIQKNYDVLRNVEIPVRPHFGFVAVAPAQEGLVDSVPPANFGGNIDNWRLGPGASIFLPVNVAEALLSLGDPHASQGDSELCGTAIECSMTALIQIVLHPKSTQRDPLRDLDYPLIETKDEWVIMGFSQPNYLRELGDKAQSEIYKKASIEGAMRDAFRKARRFLMTTKGLSEDEAISLLSVGVDFGVTQMVNGNWGAHAIIRKGIFTG
ncbi:acetamidase/formamidase family protein [Asticcacaulis sp. ZE23SCel15]|uniref:acetamidase/formamidase family protein n=1 Tax=Asticcacaulis sp. ZE23SCel15 TaxID=3059027 RepID=UPI00265E334F|nr:acetamidase/formamidase family protein [Asticcacaulis sp. ZE23SCel15]WKL57116.1 acetamidase/formamidase family protein [Asticcacaulis sp. ZE23SCel15]